MVCLRENIRDEYAGDVNRLLVLLFKEFIGVSALALGVIDGESVGLGFFW